MTRVDFYVIGEQQRSSRETTACRLVEKAYKLGHQIYIHTSSPEQSAQIDDLLWTFRAGSFVPHARAVTADNDHPPPVLVGHEAPPGHMDDVLINLAADVPVFFSRFTRVAELVADEHDDKHSARGRFRFYRDRGYPLQTHKL